MLYSESGAGQSSASMPTLGFGCLNVTKLHAELQNCHNHQLARHMTYAVLRMNEIKGSETLSVPQFKLSNKILRIAGFPGPENVEKLVGLKGFTALGVSGLGFKGTPVLDPDSRALSMQARHHSDGLGFSVLVRMVVVELRYRELKLCRAQG